MPASLLPLALRRLYRAVFPLPEERLLRELRARRLETESRPFTLPNGFVVEGMPPLAAYNEYKDIFCQGIYDFKAARPDPRILDGGAFVGFSTLRFKALYPAARVSAFECDPQVLEVLRRNLAANRLSDVEVVPCALAAEAGEREFHGGGNDGGSLLGRGGGASSRRVATRRLSEWLGEEVDFLKLNIEGAEIEVVEECGPRLRAVRELVIEYHDFAGRDQRLIRLLVALQAAGFRCLLNHYDYESNLAVKPPFRLGRDSSYILLVYARRNDLL